MSILLPFQKYIKYDSTLDLAHEYIGYSTPNGVLYKDSYKYNRLSVVHKHPKH